jgi:CHASE3 domain sensor protein
MARRLQRTTTTRKDSLLLDPVAATEEVHQVTANLRALLTTPSEKSAGRVLEERVERERQRASKILVGH